MLTLLPLLCVALTGLDSVMVPAKESAWVYAHAGDPTGDEFLRVWGAEGMAAPETTGGSEDFSYGFLKFDISGVPAGKPKRAVLILHNAAPPPFSEDDLKQTPLQARELTGEFSAADWASSTAEPGPAKDVFGIATLASELSKTASSELDIDLSKGPGDFASILAKAESSSGHQLYLALTSAIQPSSQGGAFSGIYKVYSAATKDKGLRPTLKLEF